jgi:hypothetical protein
MIVAVLIVVVLLIVVALIAVALIVVALIVVALIVVALIVVALIAVALIDCHSIAFCFVKVHLNLLQVNRAMLQVTPRSHPKERRTQHKVMFSSHFTSQIQPPLLFCMHLASLKKFHLGEFLMLVSVFFNITSHSHIHHLVHIPPLHHKYTSLHHQFTPQHPHVFLLCRYQHW